MKDDSTRNGSYGNRWERLWQGERDCQKVKKMASFQLEVRLGCGSPGSTSVLLKEFGMAGIRVYKWLLADDTFDLCLRYR